MRIRTATPSDIERIVELGAESLMQGPYKDEVKNPDQWRKTALGVVLNADGCILVAEEDGKVQGLLGFMVYPHYFTGLKSAIELMWYVSPDYRKSMMGICLARAAMRLAKSMGAVNMQMTAPTAEVGKAYEAMGFKPLETAYQKAL